MFLFDPLFWLIAAVVIGIWKWWEWDVRKEARKEWERESEADNAKR